MQLSEDQYKDDVLIDGATSTTYTATQAGTYKAVTTRPGCTGEDAIDVYNEGEGPTCSKPDLGNETIELTGSSVVLNSNNCKTFCITTIHSRI